jgi:hypothetical protein
MMHLVDTRRERYRNNKNKRINVEEDYGKDYEEELSSFQNYKVYIKKF